MHRLSNNQEIHLSKESFSGTDLKLDKDETGICYPFDENKDFTKSFVCSSIINHKDGDRYLIKHSEIREAYCINKNLTYIEYPTIGVVLFENTKAQLDVLSAPKYYYESPEDITIKLDKNNKLEIINNIYRKFNTFILVDPNLVEVNKTIPYFGEEGFVEMYKDSIDAISKDEIDELLRSIDEKPYSGHRNINPRSKSHRSKTR